MSAINPTHRLNRCRRSRQRGASAIEFALVAIAFFTVVFFVIELARHMYIYNTLHEITRRTATAAANVFPRDTNAIDRIRYKAIFRDAPGELILGTPITDEHIRICYLALVRDDAGDTAMVEIPFAQLPANASRNRYICAGNPNAENCIRFVRVQICDPAVTGSCVRTRSKLIVPLFDGGLPLHLATTTTSAESLGYVPGTPPDAGPP
jgi:hypothetical protein